MAYDVHLSIIMRCDKNDEIAELAKKHVETFAEWCEAKMYLEDISTRKGHNPGRKGGLSMWGIVGNYTCVDKFIEDLKPFFIEVYQNQVGPLDFEHIIIFSEPEQSEQATAHEISYDEESKKLNIKEHGLPFSWMQY